MRHLRVTHCSPDKRVTFPKLCAIESDEATDQSHRTELCSNGARNLDPKRERSRMSETCGTHRLDHLFHMCLLDFDLVFP